MTTGKLTVQKRDSKIPAPPKPFSSATPLCDKLPPVIVRARYEANSLFRASVRARRIQEGRTEEKEELDVHVDRERGVITVVPRKD